MNVDEVLALVDGILSRIEDTDISSFEISVDEVEFKLKRGGQAVQPAVLPPPQPVQIVQAASMQTAPAERAAQEIPTLSDDIAVVKSPIVGTFYASPAPESPPFVTTGSKVTKGDTLCILEAMKMMNEIEAERSGVITRILVKNGDLVEFGQPLFEMEAQ